MYVHLYDPYVTPIIPIFRSDVYLGGSGRALLLFKAGGVVKHVDA